MAKKADRVQHLSRGALPPRGTPIYDQILDAMKRQETPEDRRRAKKLFDNACAQIEAQQKNGFGRSADAMLREYHLEYNSRVFNHSIHSLPGSFNVADAFFEFQTPACFFRLLPEVDHLFSFSDFIDFVTTGSVDLAKLPELDCIEDGNIYSYNSTSRLDEITVSTEHSLVCGISSLSFVKFGSELNMMVVAGQKCDFDEKRAEIEESVASTTFQKGRRGIKPSEKFELGPVAVDGADGFLKTIVLIRMDLEHHTVDARYLYEDWGQSYSGCTDDLDAYIGYDGEFSKMDAMAVVKEQSKRLEKSEALFEICKTCLYLPVYFQNREEDVSVERHPTGFEKFRRQHVNRKKFNKVPLKDRISFRNVLTLDPVDGVTSESVGFSAPDFKVSTSGFWKRLDLQAKGTDKNGNPITGRTWVKKTLTWEERSSPGGKSVFVRREQRCTPTGTQGFIYIMRSAAHDRNIFKVGLTTRDSETRAKELGGTTGAPDTFLVVHEWFVSDCVTAEKAIHKRLNGFRVNERREFFRIDLMDLIEVVKEEVEPFREKR